MADTDKLVKVGQLDTIVDEIVDKFGETNGRLGEQREIVDGLNEDVLDIEADLINTTPFYSDNKSVSWEHGGVSLSNGQNTEDGSATRSRTPEYIDTLGLSYIYNPTNNVLWLVFYEANSNTYTFKNAINVDPKNSYSLAQNHARYMRCDFRGALETAQNVMFFASVADERISNISKNVDYLDNISGYLSIPETWFGFASIALTGETPTYNTTRNRVSFRPGASVSLDVGDKIMLTDYTNARMYIFYESNGVYSQNGKWITSGAYIVTAKGNYIIMLANSTDTAQDNLFALSHLLVIHKNTLVDYADNLGKKLLSALKPLNATMDAYLTQPKPLVLLHFSDIHGDATETNRIKDIYGNLIEKCDDVICTGDMVASRYVNDASFITDSGFLLCIGNHDALSDPTGWDWSQMATQQQLYDKFFSPDIANWGVTYTAGLTYYYKDYTASRVRLIVLNNFMTTAEMDIQKEWLSSRLSEALANNLSVLIAMHYHPKDSTLIECNFTRLDKGMSSQTAGGALEYRVQQFVSNGGKFIGYLVGHEHSDYIMKNTYNHIAVCIDAASVEQSNAYSELNRRNGDQTQDLYNLTVVDTTTNTIKLIRVGCDVDNYLRSRKSMCIRYDTGEIVSQE